MSRPGAPHVPQLPGRLATGETTTNSSPTSSATTSTRTRRSPRGLRGRRRRNTTITTTTINLNTTTIRIRSSTIQSGGEPKEKEMYRLVTSTPKILCEPALTVNECIAHCLSLSTTLWMSFRAVEKDYPAEWWQKSGPAPVTQNNGLGGIGGAGSPEGPPAVRQTYQGGANRLEGRKRGCLPALQNQKCILPLSPSLRSASASAAFSPSPSSAAALFPDALRAAGAAALPGLLLLSRPKHRGKQGSLSPHSQRMPYYILDGKEQQGNA